MKALIKFNLDDPMDAMAHRRAISATNAYLVLLAVREELFRPARKHGYLDDQELNKLIESEEVTTAIGRLESKFFDIMERYSVSLDDLD